MHVTDAQYLTDAVGITLIFRTGEPVCAVASSNQLCKKTVRPVASDICRFTLPYCGASARKHSAR